ncbi:hypothetical protein ACVRY0_07080 [Streptococcus intermedius]|uniref:hypothetical protein n=1 Tax=Streptococcus intermedius TaxID=1338 RepID=UPI000F668CC7|nr:hypothetical protein [Streptococcus intermedius]
MFIIHAEEKAIKNSTFSLQGSSIFTTLFPCINCTKQIAYSGIKKIYYKEGIDKNHVLFPLVNEFLQSHNIVEITGILRD